jgi:hypothetical protein
VPCLPVVKEPARHRGASKTIVGTWGVHLSIVFERFLRILLSLAQHGLERAEGGNRAPQATAIHRMEEEIQERQEVQLGREFN